MNYIYDITLNFNRNNLYEFYEWKEEDSPEFKLKIPVFKVDNNTFLDIKNNDIVIGKQLLELVENKTEVYTPNAISIIRYSCIFVTGTNAFAIEFDSDGNNYMKSNISIDEEDEIIEFGKEIKYTILDYKIKQKIKNNKTFSTRNEKELKKYMTNRLQAMMKSNEKSKLKYIFYEVYDDQIDDMDKIYNKLIGVINSDNKKFKKLNDILSLMENKKIMSKKS